MDAENDNDQPNSSSASASSSSSNNSSSSNLLGHLPMLPFMRSTDDDEQEEEEVNDVTATAGRNENDNDINEEPMSLQPSSVTTAMATSASVQQRQQQPTVTPITTTVATGAAGTSTASSSSLVGTEEPMQQAPPPHQATPPQTNASIIESRTVEASSLSQSPPPLSSLVQQVQPESVLPGHQAQQPEQAEQQLTAQINLNNIIVDTIDASAIIVQPLEAHAENCNQHPRLYPQEAAAIDADVEQQQNEDIQLVDDNDNNNDTDVDLNGRHDAALATTLSSSAIVAVATLSPSSSSTSSSAQQPQQQSATLDTSLASGSAGPSASTSAGRQQEQQQAPQTPTLPLLLQQQQQLTEESKHLPSFDHHYHNPSEFHLHAHPYQHPCVYPYGFRSTLTSSQQQQQHSNNNTNGAHNSNSIINSNLANNIMFGSTMSSSSDHHRNHGTCTSTSGLGGVGAKTTSSQQVVDRIKLLYPNVDENETPLPRCWSPHDKSLSIGLSQNNLRVHFKGVGKITNDAASARTSHPIPPACGIYYFEVKIISKGKNGYMGIGLTAQQFRMNRLPGWDKQSYGYHGDDGNSFSSSGHGQSYGPTFTTGDIIGCCVNFVNNTCFYTKNGIDLGIAFRDLPAKLYPTVGLQTPGEEVDANFGQEPFKFDQIEDMMKQMRAETKAAIYDFPLPAEQGDPTTLLQKIVNSYLVHNGYSQTAEALARQKTEQNLKEDISSIRNRQKILKLVMSGKIGQAIDNTIRYYPGLLENNKNLWFMLKCRQFIEMINGSDIENGGNEPINNNSNGSITSTDPLMVKITTATTTTAVATITTTSNTTANSSSNNITTAISAAPAGTATANNLTTIATNANATTTPTIINAQNSSHMAVIHTDDDDNDLKTQINLVEHCSSASNDAPSTISKSNNDDDYLNDVEMENNGHTTNGNICKNGNANNFNESIDADEEMDVDVAPSIKKYSHGIERILEFGKDLSQMGQQLEKENKMTDNERQMLEDAFSLIAYSNPWASPLGWQLCPTKRETVCRALNSAILESMNHPKWPPLEYCVAHANELLKVMAQAAIGSCAFVNISDVFPKN